MHREEKKWRGHYCWKFPLTMMSSGEFFFFFCIDWKIEDVVTYRKKEEVEGERKKNNLVKRVHHMAMWVRWIWRFINMVINKPLTQVVHGSLPRINMVCINMTLHKKTWKNHCNYLWKDKYSHYRISTLTITKFITSVVEKLTLNLTLMPTMCLLFGSWH